MSKSGAQKGSSIKVKPSKENKTEAMLLEMQKQINELKQKNDRLEAVANKRQLSRLSD